MGTKNFSPDGPVDVAKRPIGKCDCGRLEDSKEQILVRSKSPNALGIEMSNLSIAVS